jgi:hypothetical protein
VPERFVGLLPKEGTECVEIDQIRGGCTELCQSVDIGIGKPFKNHVTTAWETWMIEEGLQNAVSNPPTRQTLGFHLRTDCKKQLEAW